MLTPVHSRLAQPPPSLPPLSISAHTAGYGGDNCKSCITGYYRLEDKCLKCPKAAYMLILLYAGVLSECPLHGVATLGEGVAMRGWFGSGSTAFRPNKCCTCAPGRPHQGLVCGTGQRNPVRSSLHQRVCACGSWRPFAAGTVIVLLAFARFKGVNLSVLGIGVDFLQVGFCGRCEVVCRAPAGGAPPMPPRSLAC